MSINSSGSSNDSFFHPNLPSNSFHMCFSLRCLTTRPSSFIMISYAVTKVFLLLPLFIFILYCGLQQWRKKCSTSSATTVSHSDYFTYHMVSMELIDVSGCIFYFCAINTNHVILLTVHIFQATLTWYGQVFFHILTCVERYLAVVHPITYVSLRTERWIRIRNILTGCVWLMSFAGAGLVTTNNASCAFLNLILLFLALICISFCSLSILFVLTRPGPGEQSGGRGRVDQSKQRAFYAILTILAVLVLKFAWHFVSYVIFLLGKLECLILMSWVWLNVPTTLVLPLLFLHRKGKLMCHQKTKMNNPVGITA